MKKSKNTIAPLPGMFDTDNLQILKRVDVTNQLEEKERLIIIDYLKKYRRKTSVETIIVRINCFYHLIPITTCFKLDMMLKTETVGAGHIEVACSNAIGGYPGKLFEMIKKEAPCSLA